MERHSRFVMLVKVAGKGTDSVVSALVEQLGKLSSALRSTLTWARGMELADHKRLAAATGFAVCFCAPRCPWQQGTNENTNRLLRQYLPKKTDLSEHSQSTLDDIAARLNHGHERFSDTRPPQISSR
ncbi:IS30 family transposase [Streptomyces sp. NPDC056707]|uniref:IS30 family transposase n=1 Tax=Streptomyces sp. NPDC056707 TaxID=3345919 RepID=UPI0036A56DBA